MGMSERINKQQSWIEQSMVVGKIEALAGEDFMNTFWSCGK